MPHMDTCSYTSIFTQIKYICVKKIVYEHVYEAHMYESYITISKRWKFVSLKHEKARINYWLYGPTPSYKADGVFYMPHSYVLAYMFNI